MPDLEKLESLAKQATPGPWAYRPLEHDDWGLVRAADGLPLLDTNMLSRTPDEGPHRHWEPGGFPAPPEVKANGEFVAAAHPQVVLALIAKARQLAEVKALAAEYKCYGKLHPAGRLAAALQRITEEQR